MLSLIRSSVVPKLDHQTRDCCTLNGDQQITMPFKAAKPEVSAGAHASTSSAAAQRFYSDDQAATYTTPANASIQRDLSLYALELAHAVAPIPSPGPRVLLDLGAGSGLSTRAATQWLEHRGVDMYAVAFDISAAMLSLTAADDSDEVRVKEDGRKTLRSVACGDRSDFYCGNAAQKFPLRDSRCDLAIGISMLQWLTDEGLRTCFLSLFRVLQDETSAVFQIYPTDSDQVAAMEGTALDVGFVYAEVVASFPHPTAAKKWFLVLKKSVLKLQPTLTTSGRDACLCQFGRRHFRRCAWHLLQESGGDSSRAALRERLGREHVKYAWHVWRKFHRAASLAKAEADSGKPMHFKAKRSLELWKSDEMIGEALRDRFIITGDTSGGSGDTTRTTTITHSFLLENTATVVTLLHEAFSRAVAIERSLT